MNDLVGKSFMFKAFRCFHTILLIYSDLLDGIVAQVECLDKHDRHFVIPAYAIHKL